MCGWGVNHLLFFEQCSVGREPLAVALAVDDDLVAGVGEPVRALLPRIGSLNRPSHSPTSLLEVITTLAARWRAMTSPQSVTDYCWSSRCKPEKSRFSRFVARKLRRVLSTVRPTQACDVCRNQQALDSAESRVRPEANARVPPARLNAEAALLLSGWLIGIPWS